MSNIKLTQSERLNLETLHKRESERRFADRIKTVLLLDEGWAYAQIAKILLLDDQTARNYEKFKQFKDAALEFFENIEDYKDQLSSLITDNFQIIGTEKIQ